MFYLHSYEHACRFSVYQISESEVSGGSFDDNVENNAKRNFPNNAERNFP